MPRKILCGETKYEDSGGSTVSLGKQVRLTLEVPVHGGDCLSHLDGQVYFVRRGLPGEEVVAEITKQRSKIAFGQVVKVISASEYRVRPFWSAIADPRYQEVKVSDTIGGAELAQVEFSYQSQWKTTVLKDVLHRVGTSLVSEAAAPLNPQVVSLPADQETQGLKSRIRADFCLTADHRLAMTQYRGRNLITIADYPLGAPAISEASFWTDRLGYSSAKAIFAHTKRIRTWASADGLRIWDGTKLWAEGPDGSFCQVPPGPAPESGLNTGPNGAYSVAMEVPATGRYLLAPDGFWQSHRLAPQTLIEALLKYAGRDLDQVVELYAGSGLFTRPLRNLVRPGGHLSAVEGSKVAVSFANFNLRAAESAGQKGSLDQIVSPITPALVNQVLAERKSAGCLDLVVLDPPRVGANRGVCEAIASHRPRQVLYVACDPAALARDLKVFLSSGYRLVALPAWDLFPHSYHFETLAVLEDGR